MTGAGVCVPAAPHATAPPAERDTTTADRRAAARSLSQSSKWWASKVGPVLGVAYLALALEPLDRSPAAVRLAATLFSACLLATVAYVVNDWTDREADRRAGKRSLTMDLARWQVALLLTVPVAVAAAPWVVIGLPAAGWAALVAIVVLPHLYSQPPLRLKERGAWGLVADLLLAHLSPTVFVLAAFQVDLGGAGVARPVLVAALVVWAAAVGLRGIIDHEIADAEADRLAGTHTWALAVGPSRAHRVGAVVLGVEVAALATVLGALLVTVPVAGWIYLAGAAAALVARVSGVWVRPLRATGTGDDFGVLWISYGFWLPAVLLVALVVRRPELALLLPAHLVLFRSVALPWLSNVAHYGASLANMAWVALVRAVNHLRFRTRYRITGWFRYRLPNLVHVGWHHTVNWFRYRLPDIVRRAWHHGIRRTANRARRLLRRSLRRGLGAPRRTTRALARRRGSAP